MPNPFKLIDITPVTLVSSSQLQTLLLDGNRSYSIAHDSENRVGASDTTKIYLFTCTSGFPAGIVLNDNESTTNLLSDLTSGVNTSKIKLTSGRSVSIGPGINTLCYACSGNGTTAPTFLVAPDKRDLNF